MLKAAAGRPCATNRSPADNIVRTRTPPARPSRESTAISDMALISHNSRQTFTPMLQNYLKIALRSLMRTKIYSFINIAGLSLGVTCCLLLALYVKDEISYDRHHERLNDLYRLGTQFDGTAIGFDKLASVSPPITMTLKDELPEIEAAARLVPTFSSENLIQYEDNKFYESKVYVADSTIFDVLT